jgi:hypothetical protein
MIGAPKAEDTFMVQRNRLSHVIAVAWLATALPAHAADTTAADCSGFGWDMSRELALFAHTGKAVTAAPNATAAPRVDADVLYTVTLAPRASVAFAHPPGKTVGDGAVGTAGLVAFRPAQAGLYHITLDAGMWVDVVNAGQLVDSNGFRGRQPCGPIHKSVEWSLPAGMDLIVQISGPATEPVRMTITSVKQ